MLAPPATLCVTALQLTWETSSQVACHYCKLLTTIFICSVPHLLGPKWLSVLWNKYIRWCMFLRPLNLHKYAINLNFATAGWHDVLLRSGYLQELSWLCWIYPSRKLKWCIILLYINPWMPQLQRHQRKIINYLLIILATYKKKNHLRFNRHVVNS